MAYDNDFYNYYAAYLEEASVRASHDAVFQLYGSLENPPGYYTLDLGCGLSEFYTHYLRDSSYEYVGVDKEYLQPPEKTAVAYTRLAQDYTEVGSLSSSLKDLGFAPDSFISLFSIEACYPADECYKLYHNIFDTFPHINKALVSGFYYESKKDQETVEEAGDIVSYQTTSSLYDHESSIFSEIRIHTRTPSSMFGSDVVEVWKILQRR